MIKINLITSKEFFIISILFFCLSPIITWDGGHYLHYLPILNGDEKFENWDIARGVSFPILLYFLNKIFGNSLNSLLVFQFIFYILSYLIAKTIVYRFQIVKKVSLTLFYIFFVSDVLIFCWFHVLLTEFLTACIALVSIYLSYEYSIIQYSENKKRFIYISLYFIFITTFTFHLKQPYILVVILPLVLSVFTFFVHNNYKDSKTIILKILVILFSFFLLLVSNIVWKQFLISKNNKMNENRSSMHFFNRLLS